jgi:hypothetical protein
MGCEVMAYKQGITLLLSADRIVNSAQASLCFTSAVPLKDYETNRMEQRTVVTLRGSESEEDFVTIQVYFVPQVYLYPKPPHVLEYTSKPAAGS